MPTVACDATLLGNSTSEGNGYPDKKVSLSNIFNDAYLLSSGFKLIGFVFLLSFLF